jgi:lipopolysaccharide heptosyltransferase II
MDSHLPTASGHVRKKTGAAPKTLKRILVVRTDRIGDVVLSLPVVWSLRRSFPDARLGMLVSAGPGELIRSIPFLERVIAEGLPAGGIRSDIRLFKTLRAGRWDAALVLHPTLKLALILVLARIPLRVGTAFRAYSFLFNRRIREHRRPSTRHEVQYNLDAAAAIGADVSDPVFKLPVLPEAADRIRKILDERSIRSGWPLVIIHPGSRGSALEWSPEKFRELASRFLDQWSAEVIVTGGRDEQEVVDRIAGGLSGRIHTMAGHLTLTELAALLARADLFVSNSTGPLHIAAAVGTDVIGLYPPLITARALRWGPFLKKNSTLTPPKDSECRTCIGKRCPLWNCMNRISVDDVWNLAVQKRKKQ